jgi:hypothetical protein
MGEALAAMRDEEFDETCRFGIRAMIGGTRSSLQPPRDPNRGAGVLSEWPGRARVAHSGSRGRPRNSKHG